MGRSPSSSDETGLKKGPWTPEEDKILVNYIQKHGHSSWRALPKLAGLNRCGKSCRLRWTNYLRPDIKRGKFTQEEEQTILNLHSVLGNKWSAIASRLPGRTDNEIKNFWNTHLKKKLIQMGFDPMTHRPRTDIFSSLSNLIALVNLKNHLVNQHQQPLDQYLQLLLQPGYNSNLATSSSSPNLISPDLEHYYADIKNNTSPQIFNNSISSTPYSDIGVSASFENGNNRNPIISFSHMPELLQIPYSANFDEEPSNKDDRVVDDNPNYHQFPSSSTPSPPSVIPPLMAETSINYPMDIAAWPEFLLEDPSFNEFA